MGYVIASCAAMVACLAIGFALVHFVSVRFDSQFGVARRVALSFVVSAVIAIGVIIAYSSVYYHADAGALQAYTSTKSVEVTHDKHVWRFDGPGENAAFVFLPGAKVESTAYAPAMHELAAEGVDCFLVEPPLHMAFLGASQVESVIDEYGYETWLIGGHSLGGIVASSYAAGHDEAISGLVLLASYPTQTMPASVSLRSLVGSNDRVLDHDRYEEAKAFWPDRASEVVIEGGNHSGFGFYGAQDGDGVATISARDQQRETIDAIRDFADSLE